MILNLDGMARTGLAVQKCFRARVRRGGGRDGKKGAKKLTRSQASQSTISVKSLAATSISDHVLPRKVLFSQKYYTYELYILTVREFRTKNNMCRKTDGSIFFWNCFPPLHLCSQQQQVVPGNL